MNAEELERRYLPYVRRVSGLVLLPADQVMRLLDDCTNADVRFLGVEAFRLFDDGGVQPAMEFSNITYGKIEQQEGQATFTPDFGLREPWRTDPSALQNTRALVAEGAANGYSWYEVWLEDPATEAPLFRGANGV